MRVHTGSCIFHCVFWCILVNLFFLSRVLPSQQQLCVARQPVRVHTGFTLRVPVTLSAPPTHEKRRRYIRVHKYTYINSFCHISCLYIHTYIHAKRRCIYMYTKLNVYMFTPFCQNNLFKHIQIYIPNTFL